MQNLEEDFIQCAAFNISYHIVVVERTQLKKIVFQLKSQGQEYMADSEQIEKIVKNFEYKVLYNLLTQHVTDSSHKINTLEERLLLEINRAAEIQTLKIKRSIGIALALIISFSATLFITDYILWWQ
jgi:hypothetical protein